jgi:Domain of unknown function (DUF4265)
MIKDEHTKIVFKFYDEDIDELITERVWATKTGSFYKIDNIPFYAYLYSTDDIVQVVEDENELKVEKLIEPSGNSTLRILFDDVNELDKIREELNLLNCDSEVNRRNKLLAVNIPKSISYKKIIDFIESKQELQYEESCISEYHKKMM